MRVLFLAPQPFFQERGTPIAVRLALEALSSNENASNEITVITYPEGTNIEIERVKLKRVWTPRFLHGIRPGISLKKLFTDLLFMFAVFAELWRSRTKQYHVVHAVEESVFMAVMAKWIFGVPYIYDMDSSLSLQLTDKWPLLRPLMPIFNGLEKFTIRSSVAVAPVCDALEEIAKLHGSKTTVLLRDISLLPDHAPLDRNKIRAELNLAPDQLILLYVGNLEPYQGIDLLIDSFARVVPFHANSQLVVVGGIPEHINAYRKKAENLKCIERISFLGPRPIEALHEYLHSADILVSPRTLGNNAPMKIYSYLHAGRAVLATNLLTHTQVLDDTIAYLAPPSVEDFAKAMKELLESSSIRENIGNAARLHAEKRYTARAFREQLYRLYNNVADQIGLTKDPEPLVTTG